MRPLTTPFDEMAQNDEARVVPFLIFYNVAVIWLNILYLIIILAENLEILRKYAGFLILYFRNY